jgi:hypothetical protein
MTWLIQDFGIHFQEQASSKPRDHHHKPQCIPCPLHGSSDDSWGREKEFSDFTTLTFKIGGTPFFSDSSKGATARSMVTSLDCNRWVWTNSIRLICDNVSEL